MQSFSDSMALKELIDFLLALLLQIEGEMDVYLMARPQYSCFLDTRKLNY